uniref:Rho-GAP domain-containing protein n=1 Tax=Trichuris muris TaxID=70415 RepID=A0A5S6Q826_TRIMR
MNKPNRKYIKEGRISFSAGTQVQERYVFLFSDIVLIAKEKALNTYCLKEKIPLRELWISENDFDLVSDAVRRLDCCFILGWPTKNFALEFSSATEKNSWLEAFEAAISQERSKEQPNTLSIMTRIHFGNDFQPREMVVSNAQTSSDILQKICNDFGCPKTDICQLYFDHSQGLFSMPLYGFEIPYVIQASYAKSNIQVDADEQAETGNSDQKAANMNCFFAVKLKNGSTPVNCRRRENYACHMVYEWRKKTRRANNSTDKEAPTGAKFFGRPLSDMSKDDYLLRHIERLFSHLLSEGVKMPGIFRKPPKQSTFQEIKNMLSNGSEVLFEYFSPCVSASVLKEFLRRLPESAICGKSRAEWLTICTGNASSKRLEKAKRLLSRLPDSNTLFLEYLMYLCQRIVENSDINQMDSHSLSICLGPSLFQSSKLDSTAEDLQARKVAEITEFIIKNAASLFDTSFVIKNHHKNQLSCDDY